MSDELDASLFDEEFECEDCGEDLLDCTCDIDEEDEDDWEDE